MNRVVNPVCLPQLFSTRPEAKRVGTRQSILD